MEAGQQCQGEGHHITTGRSPRAESLQCQALSLGTALAPKSLQLCFAVQPLPGTPQTCLAPLTAAAKKLRTRGWVALYLPKPSSPHLQTICKEHPFYLIKKTQETILQTKKLKLNYKNLSACSHVLSHQQSTGLMSFSTQLSHGINHSSTSTFPTCLSCTLDQESPFFVYPLTNSRK